MTPQLARSESDKVLAGVAGGVADYYGWDPWLVRLAFVVGAFAGGIGVFLYAALWIALPQGTPSTPSLRLAEDRFARGDISAEELDTIRGDLTGEPAVSGGTRSPALRALEERYALGEIERDDFIKRRDVLLGRPQGEAEPPPQGD